METLVGLTAAVGRGMRDIWLKDELRGSRRGRRVPGFPADVPRSEWHGTDGRDDCIQHSGNQ